MSGKWYVAPAAAALVIIAGAGCGSGTASSVASHATSLATSSAVAKAKDQATACLNKAGVTGLLSSSGRSELTNCLKSVVPPAQREAFKNCITSAAVSDRIWTSDGRSKFMNTSLPDCLNTA
jgi:hypothetical protein